MVWQARQEDRKEREASAILIVTVAPSGSPAEGRGSRSDDGPKFLRQLYPLSVPETLKPGSQLTQVSAIDMRNPVYPSQRDKQTQNGRHLKSAALEYSMIQPAAHPEFALEPSTGILRLQSGLDHEARPKHRIRVAASNGRKVGEALIEVEVTDVNDGVPEFSQPVYTFVPNATSSVVGVIYVSRSHPPNIAIDSPSFFEARDTDGKDQIFYHLLNFNQ